MNKKDFLIISLVILIFLLVILLFVILIKRKSPNKELGDYRKLYGNTQPCKLSVPFLLCKNFLDILIISYLMNIVKYLIHIIFYL